MDRWPDGTEIRTPAWENFLAWAVGILFAIAISIGIVTCVITT